MVTGTHLGERYHVLRWRLEGWETTWYGDADLVGRYQGERRMEGWETTWYEDVY